MAPQLHHRAASRVSSGKPRASAWALVWKSGIGQVLASISCQKLLMVWPANNAASLAAGHATGHSSLSPLACTSNSTSLCGCSPACCRSASAMVTGPLLAVFVMLALQRKNRSALRVQVQGATVHVSTQKVFGDDPSVRRGWATQGSGAPSPRHTGKSKAPEQRQAPRPAA